MVVADRLSLISKQGYPKESVNRVQIYTRYADFLTNRKPDHGLDIRLLFLADLHEPSYLNHPDQY